MEKNLELVLLCDLGKLGLLGALKATPFAK
jgi:hypothetical protein